MLNYAYRLFLDKYINVVFISLKNQIQTKNELIIRYLYHHSKMPDYLSTGIKLLALIILISISIKHIKLINYIPIIKIKNDFDKYRSSKYTLFRKLLRFHDSLLEITNVDEPLFNPVQKIINSPSSSYEFLVIGSGPGGAVCANKLTRYGFRTAIFESGFKFSENEFDEFSYNQFRYQYKHAGISTTIGRANISYVEGMTVGGGSEINSGLYHKIPESILQMWRKHYGLLDVEPDKLEKYFKIVESDLNISYLPQNCVPLVSLKLKIGADSLGWKVKEVPRWIKYSDSESSAGEKMSMTKTYLKKGLIDDRDIYEGYSVYKIKRLGEQWLVYYVNNNKKSNIKVKNVVLAAGTIGTPLILKRSGISKLAGKTLKMHPTIKVVALFNEDVNYDGMGVPVHQVTEFFPDYTFGCSISSKPYIKLAILDHYECLGKIDYLWKKMAIYYAAIIPEGSGKIINTPFFNDPIITYQLSKKDKYNLSEGLKKLCKLLLSSGAIELYPCINESQIIKSTDDISKLPKRIDPRITSLMSVHLFSSCPMGEDKEICVTNSYGKVHGEENLYVSDASILPSAMGVNPQGSLMAFAHRNIDKIISSA